MIPSMKRFYKYLIVYGLAVVFIVTALAVPILTTSEDFSIYNTEWNGTSKLTERTDAQGGVRSVIRRRHASSARIPPSRDDIPVRRPV